MRAQPATRDPRVVMLAADAMPESARAARERGAIDYWTKPLDFERFRNDLQRLLST